MQLILKLKTFVLLLVLTLTVNSINAQGPRDDKHQISFLKKILLEIFHRPKLRSEIKKIFKSPDKGDVIAEVGNFIRFIEESESDEKEKILRETPCAYYTFLGLYWTYIRKNPEKAYINFAVANSIWTESEQLDPKDGHLMEKIVNWMNKYQVSNSFTPNTIRTLMDWVTEKNNEYLDSEQIEIATLEDKINKIRHEWDALLKKKSGLEKTKKEFEGKSKNRTFRLSGITTANYKKAIEELDKFILSGGTEEFNTTYELLDSVVIQITEEVPTKVSPSDIEVQGYRLGQHCDYSIQESSVQVVRRLLDLTDFKNRYDEIPVEYRQNIRIEVSLRGRADGYPFRKERGTSVAKYKGEDISEEFYSRSTSRHVKAVFSNGTSIDNEELAFLRAYCAYQSIKKLMDEFKVPEENVQYKFETEITTKKGSKFRGVDTNIQIFNFYDYYLDQIKKLSEEITRLEKEISASNSKLSELNRQIDAKKEAVKRRQETIKNLMNR